MQLVFCSFCNRGCFDRGSTMLLQPESNQWHRRDDDSGKMKELEIRFANSISVGNKAQKKKENHSVELLQL